MKFDLDQNLRQHLKNYLQNKSYREAQPLVESLDQDKVTLDAIQAVGRLLSNEYHVRLLNALQTNVNQLQTQSTTESTNKEQASEEPANEEAK